MMISASRMRWMGVAWIGIAVFALIYAGGVAAIICVTTSNVFFVGSAIMTKLEESRP